MFALAHISDLHLAMRPGRLAEFASKRGLGFINWHRRRKYIHRIEALNAITRDLQESGVDHVAVTGDLVNLSLPSEYAWARKWLESVGAPERVTVIPGNHDLYVPEAQRGPAEYWGEFMRADDRAESGTFPFIRRRGAITLIALSTALATGPFLATGQLGEDQLERLAEALEQNHGTFRVVLIHHPPVSPPNRYLRRLIDAAEFRTVLAKHGANLVLHGHDHSRSLVWLDGPDGPIPSVGVPSASALAPHGHEDASGYNIFHIDGTPAGWHCEMITRQLKADENVGEVDRRVLS
ncbi:MAG: metallophosphoesterase [Hyphomicrobiales bacterium]|nr:metallophosphoesterase [Hyphomicrobiales bacterium]